MGQVYLGSSPGGRKVAVKVIRPEHAKNAQFRARFAREVEAASRVGGFHTAHVVDADPDATSPWLVTEFISGPSLHERVQATGALNPDAVFRLGAGLAEGLAAIHGCGLVHRDIKPSNVIMADDGPRIIDFGIARTTDTSSLTSLGVVIGTFAFMSPEQVRAELAVPASDVFSLGCVLVFAASGRSPFDADSIPAIVHRIINEPPDLGGLAGDVRDVVAACLAKDQTERPSVAEVLSWLSTQNGVDTPSGGPGPPTTVTAGQAVGAAEAQAAAPTETSTRRLTPGPLDPVAPAQGARSPVAPAPGKRGVQRRTLVLGALAAAGTAGTTVGIALWSSSGGASTRGSRSTATTPPAHSPSHATPAVATVTKPLATLTRGGCFGVTFSPDGRMVAALREPDTGSFVQLSDVTRNRDSGTLTYKGLGPSLAFNRDGKILACGGKNHVVLWDVLTGRVNAKFTGYSSDCVVAYSPDGGTLAIGAEKDSSKTGDLHAFVELRDAITGRVTTTITTGDIFYTPTTMAFSPDGKTLVTGYGEKEVTLWNVGTGREVNRTMLPKAGAAHHVAFSPDGRHVAIGSVFTGVALWDTATDTMVNVEGSHGAAPVAFSPDGTTLAFGSRTEVSPYLDTVRLWDVKSGRKTTAFTGYPDGVAQSLAYSPDGKTLAVGVDYTSAEESSGRKGQELLRLWKIP